MPNPLPLTYTDAVCTDDVDAFGNETTSDLQNLQQDVFHTLLETPGSNLDAPTRGIGVPLLLGADTSNLALIASTIDHQLQEDDRIDASDTTITQEADGSWTIAITLQVAGTVLPLNYAYSASAGLVPTSFA